MKLITAVATALCAIVLLPVAFAKSFDIKKACYQLQVDPIIRRDLNQMLVMIENAILPMSYQNQTADWKSYVPTPKQAVFEPIFKDEKLMPEVNAKLLAMKTYLLDVHWVCQGIFACDRTGNRTHSS